MNILIIRRRTAAAAGRGCGFVFATAVSSRLHCVVDGEGLGLNNIVGKIADVVIAEQCTVKVHSQCDGCRCGKRGCRSTRLCVAAFFFNGHGQGFHLIQRCCGSTGCKTVQECFNLIGGIVAAHTGLHFRLDGSIDLGEGTVAGVLIGRSLVDKTVEHFPVCFYGCKDLAVGIAYSIVVGRTRERSCCNRVVCECVGKRVPLVGRDAF